MIFIADRCPPLAIDALQLALSELSQTLNSYKYSMTLNTLNDLLKSKNQPSIPIPDDLIESMNQKAKQGKERLDAELKNYKNSMIKESIRVRIKLSSLLSFILYIFLFDILFYFLGYCF